MINIQNLELGGEGLKPWMHCAKPGKPGLGTQCGPAGTRDLIFLHDDPEFNRLYTEKLPSV
jgi:hypothetical protein